MIAKKVPKRPISLAIFSNFFCNGVSSSSASRVCLIYPIALLSPTTIVSIVQSPSEIEVPDIRIGEGISFASTLV